MKESGRKERNEKKCERARVINRTSVVASNHALKYQLYKNVI